jgi:hypothetical protein
MGSSFTRLGLLLVIASLCACDGGSSQPTSTSLTAADRQELGKLLTDAQAKADALSKARDQGLRDAYRDVEPKADGAPCSTKLRKPPPFPDEDVRVPREEQEVFDEARFRMTVLPSWALLGGAPPEPLKMIQDIEVRIAKKGPRRDQFERQHSMLQKMATEGKFPASWTRDEVLKLARELGSDAYWGEELTVVAATKTDPTHDETDTFKPGVIVGRAFLWSFPEGRVTCVGNVAATNKDKIKISVDPSRKGEQRHQRLSDDLKNEAYRAAMDSLRAVGPGEKRAP